ncbi:MAG: hypothetical protein JG762_862 [Deferribacteraceae bacterium]|nr:hypothetical protein [Deferribacteraceae bacterium]
MEVLLTDGWKFMNTNETLDFEKFYNIGISDFYELAASIMDDFNFIFHRNIKELPEKRRVELWLSKKNESDKALVWIEITNSGSDISKDVPIEVLRAMNDENLTKLFFFTNGGISEDNLDILDGKNHFIFTPSEIIETVSVIKAKSENKETRVKRKKVKVPSGFILIKNYLESHKQEIKHIVLKLEHISSYANKTLIKVEQTLKTLDSIEDINKISVEERDKLKKLQYALLPELVKISSVQLPPEVDQAKEILFDTLKNCILYIGALAEYEAEEDVEKYKNNLITNLDNLKQIDEIVDTYKKRQIKNTYISSTKLIAISIIIILVAAIIYFNIR